MGKKNGKPVDIANILEFLLRAFSYMSGGAGWFPSTVSTLVPSKIMAGTPDSFSDGNFSEVFCC